MQWVYFLHSGSLLKWLHPADGNTSKSPMTSSNVSKRFLEIHLTVGWKLVKWPMSRWFHRRLASVSPSPRLLRANERLLFYFFYLPPPSSSLLFLSFLWQPHLLRSATVTGKWATVSNLSNPTLPSSHPVPPPPFLLAPLPPLVPSAPFASLSVATVSWGTVSSLALTRSKLPLLIILTFPPHLGLVVASFSVTFLFVFPSPPAAAEALQLHQQIEYFRLAPSGRSARKNELVKYITTSSAKERAQTFIQWQSKWKQIVWYNNW